VSEDDYLVTFGDLRKRRVVNNHPTLKRWIDTEDFPQGFWLGPNKHVWWWSTILTWIQNRPVKSRAPVKGIAKRLKADASAKLAREAEIIREAEANLKRRPTQRAAR
jgi:hypothetical protein